MKKITVITGHYGSGKSNLAVNLALELKEAGERVTVIDLDIVNPYFRTADLSCLFSEKGIDLVKPAYANTNLDIPAINFDLERIASEKGYLIIDVGGDDAGAAALGRYSEALKFYGSDLDMLYVFNSRRYLTGTSNEGFVLLKEIERSSRMKHTAVVNNSNLGYETTIEDVKASVPVAKQTAQKAGLDLKYTTCPAFCYKEGCGFKRVDIYIKPVWEI